MSKISVLLFGFFILPIFILAQYDRQISIITDDGIFTVSKTIDGKDMILFNTSLWDDMMKGTKYISKNLGSIGKEKTCIHISNRNCMHCTAGIGFRCGIFNCINLLDRLPVVVNNENRICSVVIQKQDAFTIRIIFLDEVDWYSLQNDQ